MGGVGSGRVANSSKTIQKSLRQIDIAMPDAVATLIKEARDGNWQAAIYLLDRRMGKPRQAVDMDARVILEPGPDQYAIAARLIAQAQGLLAAPADVVDGELVDTDGSHGLIDSPQSPLT